MQTFEDIVAWIKKNVPRKEWGTKKVEKAAIWFGCIQEAENLHENYTLKDIAGLYEHGISKYSPEHLTEWLEIKHEMDDDAEGNEQKTNDRIEKKLRSHFGV